jgi:DNA-binding NtrC family response regulator
MTMSYVLIVDDETAFRHMMSSMVEAEGVAVRTAGSGEEAVQEAARERPSLVFLDVRMGRKAMSGLEALGAIREQDEDVPVVMVTAYGDVQTAVAAMKAGAVDFLEKPVDLAEIRGILERTVRPAATGGKGHEPIAFGGIIPAAPSMQAALRILEAASRTDAPVLIAGESGTGKELAASFVHRHGSRQDGPLVTVNCAAIPSGLLEAEMFGCTRGAYTGATSRVGRFEAASGGTLLLDEIAEMDVSLQAKLLRVLQDMEVVPVGSNRPRTVDVRVIASTNRHLGSAIDDGSFREDLYYRLNVFEVVLPPLRERPEDILPLARHLARELTTDRVRRLSTGTEQALLAHAWSGNVRELRNVIERASIMARGGVIRPDHLPAGFGCPEGDDGRQTPFVPRAGASVREMERDLIAKTLDMLDGNRTRAAESLGISRRTLQYKLKRYGLDGET